ncbi:MAG TPA: hypothetical protein VFM09_06040 [Marmoricola sp.]|nr:hypothetical protein [Marmoricola sp.]
MTDVCAVETTETIATTKTRRAPGSATDVVPVQPTYDAIPGPVGIRHVLAGLPVADFCVLPGFSHAGSRFAPVHDVVVGQGGVFVIVVGPAEAGPAQAAGSPGLVAATQAAAAIAELLPRVDPAVVTPVLCLATESDVDACVEDVLVCSTGNLGRLLTAWPSVMDAAAAGFVGRRLTVQQQPVPTAPATVASPRRRGLRALLGRG